MQLLEERGQELDPRRLAQHLERTYPLRLTMPNAAAHPEIDTFEDLRDHWLGEIEIEFHRQTVRELIDRARGRLPGEAAAGLDRLRASRLPADRLAEEVSRVRDLAVKQAGRQARDLDTQDRDHDVEDQLARYSPSDSAPGQVLGFIDAVKEVSDVEVGRLDRLVSHALGAFLDDLIASYLKQTDDDPATTRDLERLQASVVEGRKGGRINNVLDVLGQISDRVEVEIDTVEEVLNVASRHEFDKWAQRQIVDIEADARRQPLASTEWAAIVEHLLATHYTERQVYGRAHQRQITWSTRLPFSFLAGAIVEEMDVAAVRDALNASLRRTLKLRETVWGRQELKRWGQATLDDLPPELYDGLIRYLGAEELGDQREQAVIDLPTGVYQHLSFVLAMRRLEEENPTLGELPGAETVLAEMGRIFEQTVLNTPVNRLEADLHDDLVSQLQSTGHLDDPAARQAWEQQPIGQWDQATRDEVARYLGRQEVAAHQALPIDDLPSPIRGTVIWYLERQRRFLDEARVQDFLVHRHLSDLPTEVQAGALRHMATARVERLGRRKISNLDVETRQVVIDSLQRQGLFHDEAERRALEEQTLAALDAKIRARIGTSMAREQIAEGAVGDLPENVRGAIIDHLVGEGLLAEPERVARLPGQRLSEIDAQAAARVQQKLSDRLRADLAEKPMEELPAEIRNQVRQILSERDYFVDPEKVSRYERRTLTQLPAEMLQGLEETMGRAILQDLAGTLWGELPQEVRSSVLTFLTANGLLADRAEELRLTQTGRLADLSEPVQDRVARHLGHEWLMSIRDRRPLDLPPPASRFVRRHLRDTGYFGDEFKEELFALQRLEEFGPEAASAAERQVVDHLAAMLAAQPVGSLPAEMQDVVRHELQAVGYFVDEARLRQVMETPVSRLPQDLGQAIYEGMSAHLFSLPSGAGQPTALEHTPIARLPEQVRRSVLDSLTETGYFVDEKKRGEVLDRRLDDLPGEMQAAVIDDLAAHLEATSRDRAVADLGEELRQALREALEAIGYFASDEVRRQVLAQPLSSLSRADLEAVAEAAGHAKMEEWARLRPDALPDGAGEAIVAHLQARGWFLDKGRLERIASRPLRELSPEVRQDLLEVLGRRYQDRLRQQAFAGLDREERRQVRDLLRERGLAVEESTLRPLRNQVVEELDQEVYHELLRDMGRQVVRNWGRRPFAEMDQAQQAQVSAYLGRSVMARIERRVLLHTISRLWIDYLTDIEDLRRGIGLEAYGQRDPLVEYKRRAFELFEELGHNVRRTAVRTLFRHAPEPLEGSPGK
ncbi:MAG: hypothetical protein JXA93_15180 [Anaerolineae bacterium]|nr:hypothetical protein [Anaerolineae bacterium]